MPKTCQTCHTPQENPEATLAPCCYCREETCFTCRDSGRHAHDERSESINYGFCLPCGKVQPLDTFSIPPGDKFQLRCSDCHFEWAPRAIRGAEISNHDQAICPFCGAHQIVPQIPCNCGKCAMLLL